MSRDLGLVRPGIWLRTWGSCRGLFKGEGPEGGNGRRAIPHRVRGTILFCSGAVTPGPSRHECDITFFVKGRPLLKSAQQLCDSTVAGHAGCRV